MSQPPTVIPAPRGPNWQLLIHSLMLLAGAGALLAYLADLRVSVVVAWPTVLIVGGLGLVVVGQLGLLRRRRRPRSQ